MSRLNPYKLKVRNRTFLIKPAPDREPNWEICRENGSSLGIYPSTKKDVKAYLAKSQRVDPEKIQEVDDE